jgi:ABC-type sugar transport system, periplasmic component
MKKLFTGLLVVAMLLTGVVGCSKEQDTASGGGEKYNVYLITMDQIDQHWVNMNAGCEKAVAELGNIDYTWLAPDAKDDAKQIECINNAIAGGANAMLIAVNGPDAVTSVLKEAENEGIKIIYVDSPANFPAEQTLATDNKAAGTTAAEQMMKAFEAAGIASGSIGIVSPNAATVTNVSREEGFREFFEGSDFTLMETQYSEGDAAKSQDIALNFITQGCIGLYGTNEGCSIGVGNAIAEHGDGVIGVGFDKSDAILEQVKNGHLLCTMAQNPDIMGYEGMKTAVNVLQGNEVSEKNVDTGVSVVTADDV